MSHILFLSSREIEIKDVSCDKSSSVRDTIIDIVQHKLPEIMLGKWLTEWNVRWPSAKVIGVGSCAGKLSSDIVSSIFGHRDISLLPLARTCTCVLDLMTLWVWYPQTSDTILFSYGRVPWLLWLSRGCVCLGSCLLQCTDNLIRWRLEANKLQVSHDDILQHLHVKATSRAP